MPRDNMVNKDGPSMNDTNSHVFPLSVSQQQVWLDQQLHRDSAHLTTGGMGFINGALQLPLFEQTVKQLVAENDAFRLLPLMDGSQKLVQHWQEDLLEYFDFSDHQDSETAIAKWWQRTHASIITLDGIHKPWHIYLVKSTPERYCIAMKYHHIVIDGYSTALGMNGMSVIYSALVIQQQKISTDTFQAPSMYPDGKTSYLQYVAESNHYLSSKAFNKDKDYWLATFPTLPANLLEKRYDYVHSARSDLPASYNHYHKISSVAYQQLRDFSKSLAATTYHLFLAAVCIYFARIYNTNEIVLGVPVLNRGGKRYKSTIGMFVVVMPLKVSLDKSSTAASIVSQIVAKLRSSYRHARYPASTLGQDLKMVREGKDCFFDITFSFSSTSYSANYGGAPTSEPIHTFGDDARYPLSIAICEFHDTEPTELVISASEDYFSLAESKQLGEHLQYLVSQMVAEQNKPYQQLPLVADANYKIPLADLFSETAHYQTPATFIHLFQQQVEKTPLATALSWKNTDDQHESFSYEKLNKQANRLAHHLHTLGLKRGDVIAVILPRRPETIVAFLAIAKLGAAFLPLAPDSPQQRINQQVKISGANFALTDNETSKINANIPTLSIDHASAAQYDENLSSGNLDIEPAGDDLAYVLFTSGSTGEPKGVMVEHASLAKRLLWLANRLEFTAEDIALQSIQLTFDPALIEIFMPLISGASVALAAEGKVSPYDLPRLITEFNATSIIFVPTTLGYFNQVVSQYPDLTLRVAISGGEILHKELANAFVSQTNAKLFNFYGPTEACIFATTHLFEPDSTAQLVPIGKPVDGTFIYIVDDNLQSLPTGTIGNIYIAGNGLARGYINDDALTKQRFIADPFLLGQKMYCTGDTGFINDFGQIQFVGRTDSQLKLRGQRIEPQEIEVLLTELPMVLSAAVKVVKHELHAWLVLDGKKASAIDNSLSQILKEAMRKKLPEYMVPSYFNQLDVIPVQSSGKTNYQALEVVYNKLQDVTQTSLASSVVQPQNPLEVLLLSLFKQVLPVSDTEISIDDHFFNRGGDSLSSLILITEINRQVNKKIPFSLLLKNPTVTSLATALNQIQQPILIDLSNVRNKTYHDGSKESRQAIFVAASGHGDAIRLSNLAQALGDGYAVYMLQPKIQDVYSGNQCELNRFEVLAKDYVAEIKSHQANYNQPPIIAGFSIGGITALETARQLKQQGIDVQKLILIDSAHPRFSSGLVPIWHVITGLINRLNLHSKTINQRTLGSLLTDQGLNRQVAALNKCRLHPLDISTTLIISSGLSKWHFFVFKPWQKLFKKHLTEQTIPGNHGSLFSKEYVNGLATAIASNVSKDG